MIFDFARPWVLLLLLLAPLWILHLRGRARPGLVFPRADMAGRVAGRRSARLARLPGWLRGAALVALVVALAAPRTGSAVVDVDAEGIAIVLAVDVSSSMLAEDMVEGNRLTAAKATVGQFITGREWDRIGLVSFAGEALTQVPLTLDYPVLLQALDQLQAGGQLRDGTAIGTAIATSANRLRRAEGQSRVLILMTDGENNTGEIDPLTAARAADAFGIRIYTIGVGSEGVAPMPVARGPFGVQYANMPVHIDEELLEAIAGATGGQYFRATNEAALDSVYRRIDALERTTVEVSRQVNYRDRHGPLLALATLALLAEWLLAASRWGRVP